jgi:hypothetical protein
MSATAGTAKNDAMKLMILAITDPVVSRMEALWRAIDDQHEGALCMAMYLTQFADKVRITTGERELQDALIGLINERWQASSLASVRHCPECLGIARRGVCRHIWMTARTVDGC